MFCFHMVVGRTIVLYSWSLIFKSILVLLQIFPFFGKTAAALPIHILTSSSVPPSFTMAVPRCTELPISSTGLPPTAIGDEF